MCVASRARARHIPLSFFQSTNWTPLCPCAPTRRNFSGGKLKCKKGCRPSSAFNGALFNYDEQKWQRKQKQFKENREKDSREKLYKKINIAQLLQKINDCM